MTLFFSTSPVLFTGTDGNDNPPVGTAPGLITGAGGNDTLVSPLNPVAPGSGIFGNAGDDSLLAQGVGDVARGGKDNDTVVGAAPQTFLFGDLGNDSIVASKDQHTVMGGAGDDSIVAQGGNNYIYGDLRADFSLSDTDTVPGNDFIVGLTGGDTMVAGGGDDTLQGGPTSASQLFGNAGTDSLVGGADGDSLFGGKGSDYLISGSSAAHDNVFLAGNLGQDTVVHLQGNNGIFGGDLEASIGTDSGNNSDYLFVMGGQDHQIFGNLDNDTLIYDGAGGSDAANVSMFGGQGDDVIVGTNGASGLFVSGDKGSDSIEGDFTNSTLMGGAGTWGDTISTTGEGNLLMGANGSDASDDYLFAFTGKNTLDGGAGADYLFSGSSATGSDGNVLTGGSGDDTYFFREGDTITPDNQGKSTYFGQAGADSVEVNLNPGDVVLPGASGRYIFSGDLSQVAFIGSGAAVTGDGKDLVSIDNSTSDTNTKGGDDTINIGKFSDGAIDAGAGNDLLSFAGTDNIGQVVLGSGNDTLNMPAFQSGSIDAGPGDDLLNIDTVSGGDIIGGAGSNTFNITTLTNATLTSGVDIDLFNITEIGSGASISAGGGDEQIIIGQLIEGGATVDGGAGNDTISVGLTDFGSGASATLIGGAGNDKLSGNPFGGDSIDGGIGNDQLFGGSAQGAITTNGGTDISFYDGDALIGGAGNDFFVFSDLKETGFIQDQGSVVGAIGSTEGNAALSAAGGAPIVVGTGGVGFNGNIFGTDSTGPGVINAAVNVDTLIGFDAGDTIVLDDTIVDKAFIGAFTGTINTFSAGSLVGGFSDAVDDGAAFDPNTNGFLPSEIFGPGKNSVKADSFYYDNNSGGLYYAQNGDEAFLVAVLTDADGVTPAATPASNQILVTDVVFGATGVDIIII